MPQEVCLPLGSSPRGRGACSLGSVMSLDTGVIPARAGSIVPESISGNPCWGHPRAGGEHEVVNKLVSSLTGSSPRGRGASVCLYGALHGIGVIPARAGSISTSMETRWSPSGHPRAGGEHLSIDDFIAKLDGSSPRGRGAFISDEEGNVAVGVIPARAGSI